MASIRRRGTSWQVLFRHEDKQRSTTFPTERGAREFQRLVDDLGPAEALKILAEREGATTGVPTLSAWCLHHIDTITGVTQGTRHRYRRFVENDLGALASRPVTAVTPDSIAAWVNALSAAGAAGKTIANKHGFLSGALAKAVRSGLIAANPCDGTNLPKTEQEEMVFLTADEFAILLAKIRPQGQDLASTLVGTGMRWGEATALRPGDFNATRQTVTISRAWKWTGTTQLVLGPPKTKRSRRTIPVPDQVAEILDRRARGLDADDWLFTNSRGKPWTTPAFHSSVWKPAVRLANGLSARERRREDGTLRAPRPYLLFPAPEGQQLGKSPRVHDLRHTCASWMIAAGVPLPVIQRHFGHESITTTIDRYGHLEPAMLAVASTALTAALVNALPQLEA